MLFRICMLCALALMAGLQLAVPGCGSGADNPEPSTQTVKTPVQTRAITISGKTFDLELALDDDSRELGLSDRKEIAEDGGMLFVLPDARHAGFVMRRCYVPIDLIYLDSKGYIDSMHRMQVIEPIGGAEWLDPSDRYQSVGRVQFVIELKGGTLDTLGLKRGDKLDLPIEELQSLVK